MPTELSAALDTERARLSGVDRAVLAGAVGLVLLAHVVGRAIEASGTIILLPFPPIFAEWAPHVSWWTLPAAAMVVAAVVLQRSGGNPEVGHPAGSRLGSGIRLDLLAGLGRR